ncbi:MAG: non-ribosomal peptide synthetase, partial [bacterium]|nr:non-ribosomal peptide synthetase [bacterium]
MRVRGGGLPLSFAQERLWFLDQLDPASPAYNIPGAFHLAGPLDQTALAEAFHLVVERHEILRTSFPSRGGQARQLIAAVSPPLGTVDLRRLPEHRRAVEARRLTSAEATRPFDLARGPVIRLNLLRLGAERHLLLLNMHHIVSDGWSLEVLLRELANGYAALSQGKRPEWPELPIQYAD